jgi:hypothetical protein
MEERQHHLNESSSARLSRSKKLEILPSPNSKSLGAYLLMDAYIFDRSRDFKVRLVFFVYYVGAHILQFPIAWVHIFWICAYILRKRIHFGKVHIF